MSTQDLTPEQKRVRHLFAMQSQSRLLTRVEYNVAGKVWDACNGDVEAANGIIEYCWRQNIDLIQHIETLREADKLEEEKKAEAPKPQRQRWEYKTQSFKGGVNEAELNAFGAEGWELINTNLLFESDAVLECIFKRPVL